jgi:hypothetical protein
MGLAISPLRLFGTHRTAQRRATRHSLHRGDVPRVGRTQGATKRRAESASAGSAIPSFLSVSSRTALEWNTSRPPAARETRVGTAILCVRSTTERPDRRDRSRPGDGGAFRFVSGGSRSIRRPVLFHNRESQGGPAERRAERLGRRAQASVRQPPAYMARMTRGIEVRS